IRCPHCSKLYAVDPGEIRTEKPHFECVDCKSRFWFSFPPAADLIEVPTYLVGEPAAQSQSIEFSENIIPDGLPRKPADTFPCTKCGYTNPKGSNECLSCGLVFEKLRKKEAGVRDEVRASTELKAFW